MLRVLHHALVPRRPDAAAAAGALRRRGWASRSSRETARWRAAAIAAGALETVSGERLGAELRLLLREPQPDALEALAEHGLGAALLPGFGARSARLTRERAGAAARGRARRDLAIARAARRAPTASSGCARRARVPGAPSATSSVAAARRSTAARALRRPAAVGGRDALLRRGRRRWPWSRRPPAREPARRWLRRARHVRAGDHAATTCSRPASPVRRSAAACAPRATRARRRAPDREAQLAAALAATAGQLTRPAGRRARADGAPAGRGPTERRVGRGAGATSHGGREPARRAGPALPAPFRWDGAHIAADLPGGRCCSPRAAAASPRARSRR